MNNQKRLELAKILVRHAITLEKECGKPKNIAYGLNNGDFTKADEMFNDFSNRVESNNSKSGIILCQLFHCINNKHLLSLDCICEDYPESEWIEKFETKLPNNEYIFQEHTIGEKVEYANYIVSEKSIDEITDILKDRYKHDYAVTILDSEEDSEVGEIIEYKITLDIDWDKVVLWDSEIISQLLDEFEIDDFEGISFNDAFIGEKSSEEFSDLLHYLEKR